MRDLTTEQLIKLKQTASNIGCYDSMKSVFDELDKQDFQSAIHKCEEIIQEHKDNQKKYEAYVQFWYLLFDTFAKNHKSAIFTTPTELIADLTSYFASDESKDKQVSITMTTCKRMDLTYRTINSMIICITDIKKWVKSFIVIDDNSSEEDRARLVQTYPFITLIKKTPEEKGHPRSMNMLLDVLKNVEYQFHVEDDWEFFYESDYITRCKRLLDANKHAGQCLVNRDYGEDQLSIINIGGSSYKESPWGEIYYEHRHFSGNELQIESAKCGKSNNLYWPHFSFRVGLTKTEVFKKCGLFNEKAQHFEMDYAHRYTQAGFRTLFLDRVYCTHIGRRTYERKDTTKKNAYDLNEEVQFGEKERLHNADKNGLNADRILVKTVVINLKRRKDRLLRFIKENQQELASFKIVEACDGKKLEPNSKLQRLFQTGDYNYRRGIMGVACSMIQVWKDFCAENDSDILIVFEDDVKCTPQFMQKCLTLIKDNLNKFDIIYTHMNPYPQYNDPKFYSTDAVPRLERYSTQKMMQVNMGSLAATILTKHAAQVILDDIAQKGVYNAIDWVAMKTCDKLRAFVSVPFLAFADCFQTNNKKDTDIQLEYDVCTFSNWTKQEIEYWETMLKGTKKNNKIRIVAIEKGKCIQLVESLGYPVIIVKPTEIKQNDILIQTSANIKEKCNHITLAQIDTNVECMSSMWYVTDKLKFIIPSTYLNETNYMSKTWGDNYLNKNTPL